MSERQKPPERPIRGSRRQCAIRCARIHFGNALVHLKFLLELVTVMSCIRLELQELLFCLRTSLTHGSRFFLQQPAFSSTSKIIVAKSFCCCSSSLLHRSYSLRAVLTFTRFSGWERYSVERCSMMSLSSSALRSPLSPGYVPEMVMRTGLILLLELKWA